MKATFRERFERHVIRGTGVEDCWGWKGSTSVGYARFHVGSRPNPSPIAAHRFSYEEFVGPIPDGFVIDHLCCKPICTNPKHLEAVPHKENIRRAYERKPYPKGVKRKRGTLTKARIRQIEKVAGINGWIGHLIVLPLGGVTTTTN